MQWNLNALTAKSFFVCRRYHISKSWLMHYNKKIDKTREFLIDIVPPHCPFGFRFTPSSWRLTPYSLTQKIIFTNASIRHMIFGLRLHCLQLIQTQFWYLYIVVYHFFGINILYDNPTYSSAFLSFQDFCWHFADSSPYLLLHVLQFSQQSFFQKIVFLTCLSQVFFLLPVASHR